MSAHSSPTSPVTPWRVLGSLLRPHRRTIAALGVVLAISSGLPLVGPQLLRAFIDAAVDGARMAGLLGIAGLYAGLGLASQAIRVGLAYVATRVAWTVTNDLRRRACDHVLGQDLAFHAATSPGALIERIDGDATEIARFFTDFVVKVISALLMTVGAVALVAREDAGVALAMAAFVLLTLTVVAWLRNRAVPAASAERAAFAQVIGLVEEQLDGAEDLRALGARDDALGRHERASGRHLARLLRSEKIGVLIWTASTGMFVLGSIAMLGGGWWLHATGAITVGTVFLLFQYVQVLRRPIEEIAEQLQQVQRAAASAGRMAELLSETASLPPGGSEILPGGALHLEVDHVGFAYADRDETATDPHADPSAADTRSRPGTPVLDDVSIKVEPGQVVGLVGRSGSGKTTLARLALRLVDPTTGAIRLGGVDLRDADPDQLRERVAIVTQDVQLFRASVRENLTLFDPQPPPDERLGDVLGQLGLASWLRELPHGLDTILGDGTTLSAGEAQLLGLARAFLRDPGLVVLDEASSRIDPATAELVERALDRLLAGRTAIIIAHRLSAVNRADHILVLADGRVVEHGDRDVLADDPTTRFAGLLRGERAAAVTPRQEVRS